MVLSKEQLIEKTDGFYSETSGGKYWTVQYSPVTDIPDPDNAFQPNGIDLSLAKVEEFVDAGHLGRVTKTLPKMSEVKRPSPDRPYYLQPGTYFVTFNETVKLPKDVMAYTRPRSTLLRSGVALHTAVWDAGYEGKGGSLLVVYNEAGFFVQRNARIAQMVFHRLEQPAAEGYNGSYQREGLTNFDKRIAAAGEAIKNGPLFLDPYHLQPEYARSYAEDGVTAEFAESVDEFIDRYRPALTALANGDTLEFEVEASLSPHNGWELVMLQNTRIWPEDTRDDYLNRIDAAFARLNPLE